MNYLPSPQSFFRMSWLLQIFLVHCHITFSDDFPQHGKAWKSMESTGTSLCLQIGYIQRIFNCLLSVCYKTTLKALNLITAIWK